MANTFKVNKKIVVGGNYYSKIFLFGIFDTQTCSLKYRGDSVLVIRWAKKKVYVYIYTCVCVCVQG